MTPKRVTRAQTAYGALVFIVSLEKFTIFEILVNWPPGGPIGQKRLWEYGRPACVKGVDGDNDNLSETGNPGLKRRIMT